MRDWIGSMNVNSFRNGFSLNGFFMIIIFCLVLNRVCGPTRDLSEAKVYGIDGNIMPLRPFLPALAKLTKLPLKAMHGETAERLYEWVKDHGIQQVSTDYM